MVNSAVVVGGGVSTNRLPFFASAENKNAQPKRTQTLTRHSKAGASVAPPWFV